MNNMCIFVFTIQLQDLILNTYNYNDFTGEAKINPNANYSYTISSKLALKYFEKDDDYSFNYTKAEVKLLEVTDENNAVLKVTPKEREMIENFFSTKLIFDIKKNF